MPRYVLSNAVGDPLVVVDAATQAIAESYGRSKVTGFAGDVYQVNEADREAAASEAELRAALAGAFTAMGLSESESAHAARGRSNDTEATLNGQLAELFRAMGLPAAVAESAAIGRESPYAVKRRAEREIPVVTVAVNASGAQSVRESPATVKAGELVQLQESARPVVALRESRALSAGEVASLRAITGQ